MANKVIGLLVLVILVTSRVLTAKNIQNSDFNAILTKIEKFHLNGVNSEPRIINGTVAELDKTLHQVSIRLKDQDFPFGQGHICGGSIISETEILTAAHCLFDHNPTPPLLRRAHEFSVVMGTLDRTVKDNFTLQLNVNGFIYHKSYNLETYENDIAILILSSPILFSDTIVRRISISADKIPIGTKCQVTGWGKENYSGSNVLPEKLLTTDVEILDTNVCNAPSSYNGTLVDGMMCAGFTAGGSDACQGDSGGPLVCNGILAGVVSWGYGCGSKNYPGIYTEVAFYKSWISFPYITDKDTHSYLNGYLFGNGGQKSFKRSHSVRILGVMIILCLLSYIN